MNLDESLREILENYISESTYMGEVDDEKEPKAQTEAIAKIKALVVESLPKERTESIGQDHLLYSPEYKAEETGYNQCLGEIRSIWAENKSETL